MDVLCGVLSSEEEEGKGAVPRDSTYMLVLSRTDKTREMAARSKVMAGREES